MQPDRSPRAAILRLHHECSPPAALKTTGVDERTKFAIEFVEVCYFSGCGAGFVLE